MATGNTLRASNDQLRTAAEAVVERAGLADELLSIAIDPNDDVDNPFVRVNLRLRKPGKLTTDRMISLQEAIEEQLMTIDERFASVRFAEVA